MSKKTKQKYYVVWKGLKTGIFPTWDECKAQVVGTEGAMYKAFETLEEAQRAYAESPQKHIYKKASPAEKAAGHHSKSEIIKDSISVDAACNTMSGDMEYRGVYTWNAEQIFHRGPYRDGTNNIGEFLALVHALALLEKSGKKTPVYSDSRTAIAWVRKKRANTKLEPTSRNAELFDLVSRAENWLKEHPVNNPILKWETQDWGEIPADFGRK
jgi:ribonuclease HI